MSKTSVDQVIRKAIGDAAFRAKLHSDPGSALAGFDLTKDERSAITSGDPKRLTALGVDQRMSKAFDLGGQAAVSKVISPEPAGLGTSAIVDEGGMNAMNLRRIEGDLNVSAARTPADVSGDFNRLDEGTVSSTTSARDAAGGSAIRDAHDSAAYSTGGSAIRDAHDAGAYSATSARDAGSSVNASNLRRVEGDLNVGGARQPADASGDFNQLDEGVVGETASKFETTVDPRTDGFLAKELDPGSVAESIDTPGTGLDAGGHNISE